MHIICPSMPIPASTELAKFFVYFRVAKNYLTVLRCLFPSAGDRTTGGIYPLPLPTSTVYK